MTRSASNAARSARAGLLSRSILAALLLALPLTSVAAQAGATDVGGLRAYWHVFIAYAIVIVLVLVWVASIGRRLKDVEQRLGE